MGLKISKHGPESDKSASTFLKLFPLVVKVLKKLSLAFLSL